MKFYFLFDWNEISKFTLLKLGGVEPQSCHGHLKVKDVNFAYPTRPKNPVMSDFSIEIKPGETVALVGESGQVRVWIGIFYFLKSSNFSNILNPSGQIDITTSHSKILWYKWWKYYAWWKRHKSIEYSMA